jgi:hypothetical protein
MAHTREFIERSDNEVCVNLVQIDCDRAPCD